jgi:hypothetical protein
MSSVGSVVLASVSVRKVSVVTLMRVTMVFFVMVGIRSRNCCRKGGESECKDDFELHIAVIKTLKTGF